MKKISHMMFLALIALTWGCVTSLRPPSLEERAHDAALQTQGRQLLARAAKAHGVSAWRAAKTIRYEMNDHWMGLLGRLGNPWPDSQLKVRLEYRLGSFDGRATFLSGDEKGTTWGLQTWRTYVATAGEAPRFKDNKDARFILPAAQYLLEFPFRAQSIELVAYAGPRTIDGTSYETVFATWRSFDKSKKHDQYLVYINPSTHMIEKVEYTIREFAGFAKGAIHYQEFKDFSGLKLPMRQIVNGAASDQADPTDCVHVMTIDPSTVQLDAVAMSEFVVDPKLALLGDEKLTDIP